MSTWIVTPTMLNPAPTGQSSMDMMTRTIGTLVKGNYVVIRLVSLRDFSTGNYNLFTEGRK